MLAGLLLLLTAGCAHAPARQAALPADSFLDVRFAPAAMDDPEPLPHGFSMWPSFTKLSPPQPWGLTNADGVKIEWLASVEFEPALGVTSYRVEFEGTEFGPRWYFLTNLEHDGGPGRVFWQAEWRHPEPPRFRILIPTI